MREHLQQQAVSNTERYRPPERLDEEPIPSHAPLAKNLADDIGKIFLRECLAVIRNVCAAPGRKELSIGGPALERYFDRHTLEEYGDFCVRIENLMKEILGKERYVDIYSDGTVILNAAASKKIVSMIRECCYEGCDTELNAISRHLAGLEFKLKEPIKPFIPKEIERIIQSHVHINHPADHPKKEGSFTIYMQDSSFQSAYGYTSDVKKLRRDLLQVMRKINDYDTKE